MNFALSSKLQLNSSKYYLQAQSPKSKYLLICNCCESERCWLWLFFFRYEVTWNNCYKHPV